MHSQCQPIINVSTAMSHSPGGILYQATLPNPPGLCLNMRSRKTTTKDPNEARMRRLVNMKTGTGRNWIMNLNPIIILKWKRQTDQKALLFEKIVRNNSVAPDGA